MKKKRITRTLSIGIDVHHRFGFIRIKSFSKQYILLCMFIVQTLIMKNLTTTKCSSNILCRYNNSLYAYYYIVTDIKFIFLSNSCSIRSTYIYCILCILFAHTYLYHCSFNLFSKRSQRFLEVQQYYCIYMLQ